MKRTIIIAGIAGTTLVAAGAYAGGNKAGQAQHENIPYSSSQSSAERTAEAQGSPSSSGAPQASSQDSETVKKVQSALAAQGYDPGPVDGKIGARTQQALKQAQKDKGLSETGQIDAQTLAVLGASESGQPSMSPEQSGG